MDYVISLLGPLSQGAVVTLKLFAITLVLSVPLGLVLALLRLSLLCWAARVGGWLHLADAWHAADAADAVYLLSRCRLCP